MVELPKETKDLITEYQNWERSLRPTEEATIHVEMCIRDSRYTIRNEIC